jgi:hypothetical protein
MFLAAFALLFAYHSFVVLVFVGLLVAMDNDSSLAGLLAFLVVVAYLLGLVYLGRRKGKPKSKSKPKDTGSWFDGGRKAMIQLAGELFWKMGEDLDSIAKDYTASLDAFITQLPMQQHVDLKFLLFCLDFTEYYGHVSSNK